MNTFFVKYLFLIFLFTVTISYGQEVITKSVAELAQLPDNEFYDVLQDSKGNYWFCADSGLYRFNGIAFVHYKNPEQRSQSLFNLKEDDFGRIWCNSLSGQFFVVDPEKDRLELFIDAKDQLIGNLPKYELYQNNLIIQLDNGKFLKYNFDTKKRTVLLDNIGVHSDIERLQGKLFYASNKLHFFNLNTQQSHSYPIVFQNDFIELFNIDEELYIICSNSNHKITNLYVVRNNKLSQIKLPEDFSMRVYELHKNKQDLLLFATEQGVKVMQEKNLSLHYKFSILQNTKTSKIIEDTFGNYIITTLNRGIHYWNGQENFQYHNKNFDIENDDLHFIHQLNSNEFLVTDFSNNIYKFKYQTTFKLLQKWHLNTRIRRLYTFNNDSYIIGDNSPLFYLKENTKISHTKNGFASIKDIDIKGNKLYVADTYRLASIDAPPKDTLKTVFRKKRCISVNFFQNELYGAFADGIFKIKNDSITPITYKNEILYADRLLVGTDYLWAIKKNQGLFFGENEIFQQLIALKDHNAIVKKSNDSIYILEAGKLQRINENTLSLELVKDIALQTKNIKIVDFEVIDNICFLTTNQGILQISLHKDGLKNIAATTFIDKILINETPIKSNELKALSYNENSVKLFLKNTDFAGRTAYTFRYKINGKSSSWQSISDIKNPIYLSYLSPASYELTYQTLKNTKVIHEDTIRFTIHNPYWKTWWFFSIILIVTLGITFIILRLYITKIKAKQHYELEQLDLKKNLAEAKLQNLTSQMNPHFTFNALNTVQGLILDDKKEDAYTYLAHFSNLFRKSIDFSSKTFNTFDEEITFLKTYLKIEAKRFNNQLDYQIDDTALEDRFFKIPAMILQPFVENAIKHGLLHKKGEKRLRIQFLAHIENIECIITDNGIGRKASELLSQNRKNAHLNMATSSVQKRFDLYKKHHNMEMSYQYNDLVDANGESSGTKVIITIPLMK